MFFFYYFAQSGFTCFLYANLCPVEFLLKYYHDNKIYIRCIFQCKILKKNNINSKIFEQYNTTQNNTINRTTRIQQFDTQKPHSKHRIFDSYSKKHRNSLNNNNNKYIVHKRFFSGKKNKKENRTMFACRPFRTRRCRGGALQ